ncbi:carboxypeptidase regulatory-like domain-containing protein [Verminephrobacter aporrectodeae subsp. tuberculatae]|uniref:Carboxypeptidase regulatory-like domain-containing protein n=1 Tax=Verminephrobacter aporrectodeae subsp. tuberculatae TaxID=1110392 RepID=A0ABT3KT36_9BURK|nr:carboxypeptidase-like regulatory domain-containing protein [Verminephrobacter aporrectodeae]MCW5321094.1 carboxypeptidase regulatory-like domain-containing protein [Verminephrobacter aporrectodeae subsp. tuberculatae]
MGEQDVLITGRAVNRASQTPMPGTRLKLILNQQGFERSVNIVTDAAGNFVHTFKPTLTDAGLYKVSAIHPEITDRPEQKSFTIQRVTVGPTPYKLDVPKNYPFSIPLFAQAGAATSASGLRLTLDPASQPTGQVPDGISVQLPSPVNLGERQRLNLPVLFTASNAAQPSGSLILTARSDEHAATPLGLVRVDYTLSEALPYLVSTPSLIETGLAQGSTQVESVTVKNNGLQDALNLHFSLTKTDGTPAPAWASMGSAADGSLAIGQSRAIDLAFSPPPGTPEGVYEYRLRVVGDNVPAQALNVYVSVTQSGQGNVLFKAADIYTATIGKNGQLIPGLAEASITMQNEDVGSVSRELNTDALGEALFQNLPAGRYRFRARAANHQDASGRLLIRPGITANQPVFLNYNAINVEWSVREITIQDRYEVTLNATFETDVPAAVVVLQPASTNLPKMAAGDVYHGELTLTNYGLIRADNVKQKLPQSDAYFRYEFLVELPVTLQAKQRITIPYRVIALQSLDAAAGSGNASGGGCHNYSNTLNVSCDFQCANGTQSDCGASTSWFSVSNSSCPGSGGGPGSSGAGAGSGGFWGGGGSSGFGRGRGSSTPIKMKGKRCVYVAKGGTECN